MQWIFVLQHMSQIDCNLVIFIEWQQDFFKINTRSHAGSRHERSDLNAICQTGKFISKTFRIGIEHHHLNQPCL